jgi:hypothetical protein
MADEKPTISSIRTFKGDVNNVVTNDRVSLVGMAMKEKERRERRNLPPADEKKSNVLLISAIVIFVLAGIFAGILFFLSLRGSTNQTPQQEAVVQSLLFADANKELNVTNLSADDVVSNLRKEMTDTQLRLGTVENIFFTTSIASSTSLAPVSTFFDSIGASAPDGLVRSLDPNFMYGIHIFDKNKAFILLKTTSYEKSYAEMLDWEKNYMYDRLARALTTDATQGNLSAKPFGDEVVKNIDSRVLKDEAGNIIFLYAFLNRNYLVITTGVNTFSEVLSRFTTPKPVIR